MKARWAFALVASWLTVLGAKSAEAQYVSYFPSHGQGETTPYRSAFPTEAMRSGPQPGYPTQQALAMQPALSPYIRQASAYGGPYAPGMPMPGAMPMPGMMPGAMPMQGPPMSDMPMDMAVPATGMPGGMPGGGPMPFGSNPLSTSGSAYGCGTEGAGYGVQGGPFLNGCCGPRWYDVSVELLYLTRENTWSDQPFTSDGIAGFADPNIVLRSDDLDFDLDPGVRVMFRYEVGAASNLEAGYLGLYGSDASAEVVDPTDNLFSVFSEFGNQPFLGFDETDRSDLQRLDYDYELHGAELNYRRSWMSPAGRVQGSWLLGIRYLNYTEDFAYFTRSTLNSAQMNYAVDVTNDMLGFQLGGDSWLCIVPGLMIGVDGKAGVYGNQAVQHTHIEATGLDLRERAADEDVAFMGEVRAGAAWQIFPNLTLTGGYQLIALDGVALAVENFNATPPFVNPGTRANSVAIDEDGSALFHGFYSGIEYLW